MRLKHIPFILALGVCAPSWAGNFAECLLDKLPGTMNDQAAHAIRAVCSDKYQDDVPQGTGRGLFSYKSGTECLAAKGKDTRSTTAVQLMSWACRRLYDESEIDRFLNSAPQPR